MSTKLAVTFLAGVSICLSISAYAIADGDATDMNWSYAMVDAPVTPKTQKPVQKAKVAPSINPSPYAYEEDLPCDFGAEDIPEKRQELTLTYVDDALPIATSAIAEQPTYQKQTPSFKPVTRSIESVQESNPIRRDDTQQFESIQVQEQYQAQESQIQPVVSSTSEATLVQQPVKVQYPITRQYPISVQYPVTVQREVTIEQPVVMQQPVIVRKPLIMQQAVTVQRQPAYVQQQPMIMQQQPTYVQQQPITMQAPSMQPLMMTPQQPMYATPAMMPQNFFVDPQQMQQMQQIPQMAPVYMPSMPVQQQPTMQPVMQPQVNDQPYPAMPQPVYQPMPMQPAPTGYGYPAY